MPSAILFDYGLTLVTFEKPTQELLRMLDRVRPWLGPDAPPAEWLLANVIDRIDASLDGYGEDEVDYLSYFEAGWKAAGLEVPSPTLWRILDLEQRCWDGAVRVAPDAFSTLGALRARGLKLAIASNAPFPPEMLHRQLRTNGLAHRVDAAVFSSEVGKRKPAAELYQAALDRLGAAAGDAVYVGDRPLEDFDGPRRLGMDAVLCTAMTRSPIPPGVPTVSCLGDLVEWVG